MLIHSLEPLTKPYLKKSGLRKEGEAGILLLLLIVAENNGAMVTA